MLYNSCSIIITQISSGFYHFLVHNVGNDSDEELKTVSERTFLNAANKRIVEYSSSDGEDVDIRKKCQ